MRFYWLTLGILGVWRITYLLHAEDGPWNVLARIRRSLGAGVVGQTLDCFYCLSLWVAIPLAWWLGQTWVERLLLWLGLSGAAILLHRATTRPEFDPPLKFLEDPLIPLEEKEPGDVLRRQPDSLPPGEDQHPNP